MISEYQITQFVKLCSEVAECECHAECGTKYARIVSKRCGQGSAYGFLDLQTGAVLKAESWKKPQPTPRGNINNPDGGRSALTKWGAVHMR